MKGFLEKQGYDVTETLDEKKLPIKMIGDSKTMKEVFSLVRRIAPTDWTVLIQGETGTGKELIARILHLLSPRNEKPLREKQSWARHENHPGLFCLLCLQGCLSDGINQFFNQEKDFTPAWIFWEKESIEIG